MNPSIIRSTLSFSPFRNSVRLLFALLLALWLRPTSLAQAQPGAAAESNAQVRPLKPGERVERELAGGQSHSYQLTLAAGQYLHIVAEQRGVDVVVTLFGPEGKKLVEVDSPNGTQGPEPLLQVIEAEGVYRLEVRSLEKEAAPGRYEVKIVELRAATAQDRDLIEALKAFTESAQLRDQGKYNEGIPLAERALALREKALGADHVETAAALNNLARLYRDQGNYAKAEQALERALAIFERAHGPEHPAVATALNTLAGVSYYKGDHAKAESLYRRSIAVFEKTLGPQHQDLAASLNGLAIVYRDKGDNTKAEPLYQRALAIYEKALGPDHPFVSVALHNLASVYNDKGEYARAEPLYQRALAIVEKAFGPEHPDAAYSLQSLAGLYRSRGDYARAEPLLQRALAIREKALGAQHPVVSDALNDLAGLYLEKGDSAKAEPLYQRALAIREKALGAQHPSVSVSLNNLASLYSGRGEYAKAEPLLQRALAIAEKVYGPDHVNVAAVLNILGLLYHYKEDYAKAEPLYQRTLAIREKALGPEHPVVIASLNNLASLYRSKRDFERAEPLYQRALAVIEKTIGPDHTDAITVLSNLAMLYRANRMVSLALEYQRRAAESGEINLRRNLASGSERQKLSYLSLLTFGTDRALSLHLQAAPADPQALRLAVTTLLRRKGRALDTMTDAIAQLRRRASPEEQALLDQLAAARTQLAGLTLRGPDARGADSYRERLKQLEDQVEKIEAEISSRNAEFRTQAQPVTLEAIQAAIPRQAALVEFALYRPFDDQTLKSGPARYAAYTLTGSGRPRWVDLGEAEPIDRNVAELRQSLRDPKRTDAARLARAVDERVMRPVRKLLPDHRAARRVFISPDGALNLVPFAALVDEHDHYLVEHYEFSYLTSGRDLLRLRVKQPSRQSAMIVAAPDFGEDQGGGAAQERILKYRSGAQPNASGGAGALLADAYFPPLPGTADEAQALKAMLPEATALTRAQATESAIKQVTSPRLLHIATHGFFLEGSQVAAEGGPGLSAGAPSNPGAENPLLRSGLALSGANLRKSGDDDGILTAVEAAALDLSGTKLVVLSACDTGVGEIKTGEGVYGLRRALVLAGSETQVMSLWPVSDRATRDLMVEYYRRLLKGEGRSAALRDVQLGMLKANAAAGEDKDRLLVTKSKRDKDGVLKTKDEKKSVEKILPPGPKDYSHPYYWASFIQSGEWANLDGKR